eukprot:g10816.t1
MEEQGKEWQPATSLRELAALSELKRDVAKAKVDFEKATGQERRRWLELRHNQTLATAEMELDLAKIIAEEKASLAVQSLIEEEKGVNKLGSMEESLRISTEVALLLVDVEAAAQTARLSSDRRLSESLATLKATKSAEREVEAEEVARIRARGAEARRQTQAVVDETFSLVGSMVLSAVSDPVQLVGAMAALLGVAFAGLLVGNSVSLAARAVRRRVAKPRLVRNTDLPGSPPTAAAAWVARRFRSTLLPLVGKSPRCSGLDPMSVEALEGVVLPPNVERRLRGIAISIRSAYSRGAPLPHVLIHGAPGSGKSVLARRLAKMCDLYIVVVAGADVGSLGRSASSEISGLMRWAGSSGGGGGAGRGGVLRRLMSGGRGRGVVVVMDEAEAALGDRRKKTMSENARSALNAVLLCTGELRPGFLMVLTTSRPQDLDEAVLDRVDEVVALPKPGLPERARLIRQYYSAYLLHDPPADFLESPASAASTAASTGTMAEAASGGRGVAARWEHDDCSLSGRDTSMSRRNAPCLHPDLAREAKGCPSVGKKAEMREYGKGRGRSRARDGAMRISEGFRDKAPGLMAMLAVRSEGFYGRDMAHFFSAVQAAVFASEECELTEGVWATTERNKLQEFSTKLSMTAGAAGPAATDVVPASINPASRVNSVNEPLEPSAASQAKSAKYAGVKGKMGRGSTAQHGTSSPPPVTTAATTTKIGKRHAAPFQSSTLRRGGGGGGDGAAASERPRDDAVFRGRCDGDRYHPAATTTIAGGGGGAPDASRNAAAAGSTGSREDTGSEVEEEVEALGCGLSLSSPNDPEITHPRRVTE